MCVPHVVLPAGLLGIVFSLLLLVPVGALGHCDTMNGPVVGAAKKALAAGDVTSVLKWVKPENEADIVATFKQTLAVRKQGKDARELADKHFFETLVRLHRAGEGAPYTGLKDTPVEPIIAKTDAALTSGSIDEVVQLLSKAMDKAVREKFDRVMATAKEADKNLEAGREYVEAYVVFTHYVERLHNDITGGVEHGAGAAPAHEE